MNVAVRGVLAVCGALKSSWSRTVFVSAQRYQNTASESRIAESIPEDSLVLPMPVEVSHLKWDGKKFEELPIVHIKATYNNTHIQVTSFDHKYLVRTSCGTEGFRNARKSSSVAAQTAGIAAATHAIKGLTMGGLEVISLTDNTPIPHNGCRPRKARRL
ncbi:small ribosomal subunit protein uS11m isoform 2-T2 [Mantella aurantiaca]